jgi:hypothetical protein
MADPYRRASVLKRQQIIEHTLTFERQTSQVQSHRDIGVDSLDSYTVMMEWEVEYTDEFNVWWSLLDEDTQEEISIAVANLGNTGPTLGRPLVDTIKGSRHSNMKELRIESTRILFAFDPRRMAILLIGGDKRGRWNDWYAEMIPIASTISIWNRCATKEKSNAKDETFL